MPRTTSRSSLGIGALAGLTALWLAACTNNPGSTTTIEGRYISDKTVERLNSSNTDADWITLIVGNPTGKHHDLSTNRETWRWEYSKSSREHRLNAPTHIVRRTLHAEFENGKIMRAWTTESVTEE